MTLLRVPSRLSTYSVVDTANRLLNGRFANLERPRVNRIDGLARSGQV